MKNQILTRWNYFWTMLMLFLASPLAFAQEGDGLDVDVDLNPTTTTTTTTTEEWFTNPLYWIIGALVLLVVIAIIARGNRR